MNISLYSKKDIELIKTNLGGIIDSSIDARNKKLEPLFEEYKKVNNIIKKYIKENRRIIYGGYAWNKLIEIKDKNDVFYKKNDRPDIEFFSPYPIEDVKNICDLLHKEGLKYVTGKSAHHEETYSIFSNFENVADISYMPLNIFKKIDFIKVDKLMLISPKIILIDILRQYNDPLTSYWRIEKAFNRMALLFKHYTLNINGKFKKLNINKKRENILNYIRKDIIIGSKLLVFGYYAYEYYIYKSNNNNKINLYVPYYDIISLNFKEDAEEIYKKLKNKYNNITKKEYYEFFQFTSNKISILYDNKVILNIYHNNNMCIPYKFLEKKNIYIVTYTYTIMRFLMEYVYNDINNLNIEKENMGFLIKNIIDARNKYLKENNKTILDITPFQEFIIDCLGNTMDGKRKYFITITEKRKQKKKTQFIYDPKYNHENFNTKAYRFNNSSGNLIRNSRDYIIK
jgi:hypothetical protein